MGLLPLVEAFIDQAVNVAEVSQQRVGSSSDYGMMLLIAPK